LDQRVSETGYRIVKASLAERPRRQLFWGLDALTGSVTQAAWKTKPSWYLVAKDDHMIPPDAQRFMSKRAGATVVETKGSHALYVSHPGPVAALIKQAAAKITTTASR
jgi:pimeloyl-ACP methyl ester carboxylesterase